MTKSLVLTYLFWGIGGWFGLHHFYLGRDRQAFIWWSLVAGYGGLGWIVDLFKIPRYVKEANYDSNFEKEYIETIKKTTRPPFSLYRFIGGIAFGNLLSWVIYKAIPEETIFGYSLTPLFILIPIGAAFGVYTVGNIGFEEGPFIPCLIASYIPTISWLYFGEPNYYPSSLIAAFAFRYNVKWRRKPVKRRPLWKRVLILGGCGLLYASLWSSFLYFNFSMPNEHGETIKFRDSLKNLLNSQLGKEFQESVRTLWEFYKAHGWGSVWNEFLVKLDPLGERNALKVLGLPAGSSQEEIKARWRVLSKKYHPDKFLDPKEKEIATEKFMEIKSAFDKLFQISSKRSKKARLTPHDEM